MSGAVRSKESIAESFKDLKEQKTSIADEIREYVRGQRELWNQIPNLCLEADGRHGYLEDWSDAYYNKTLGLQNVYIDLVTGEIINYPNLQPVVHVNDGIMYDPNTDWDRKAQLAPDGSVVDLDLEGLDAEKHIENLREQANQEYWRGYNPRKIAQWRADIRAEDKFLQDTLPHEFSLEQQHKNLVDLVKRIESEASDEDSELTPDQIRNAIGHVLFATDYDDREDGSGKYSPVDVEIRGAQEIITQIGSYIELKSVNQAKSFHDFSYAVWTSATTAAAKLRAESNIPHSQPPESLLIYKEMGEQSIKRADGNNYSSADPKPVALSSDEKIGTGFYTAVEVADWLVNTKPGEVLK